MSITVNHAHAFGANGIRVGVWSAPRVVFGQGNSSTGRGLKRAALYVKSVIAQRGVTAMTSEVNEGEILC